MNPLSYPLVSTSSADTESNDEGSALTKQLFDDSGVVTSPPPQPRCWFNALKVFSSKEKEEIETLNQMCATMGPQEQQAFAFEIARCHLAEMGRSIVETIVGLSIDNVKTVRPLLLWPLVTMATGAETETTKMVRKDVFPT